MATYVWLCLVLFSQFTSVFAQSEVYIVHMDSHAMPKIFTDHHSWYDSILSSMPNDAQITTTGTATNTPKLLYTYTNAMNGFSATLSPSELKAVENSPGFISAIRDVPAIVHTSHSFEFLGLNDVSGAWPTSSYGKDVIIGVIDSGVWPESESYNDDGMGEVPARWKGKCENGTAFNSSMCNRKLIGARSFNKALVASDPTRPISMNSPRDDDGHGTHTSSTAAGNYVRGASYFGYATGTTRGMAPKAHLAIYKTLWNEGSSGADTIAAIDQAIADGVDVLSLSISYDGFQLYEEPIAIASFAAMKKGIFVAVSGGNRGYTYGILHNGTPWLLTVGAGTIDRQFIGTKPAPTVASYSSRGPSTLRPTVLKPDLIAPGSLIIASWPRDAEVTKIGSRSVFGNFSIISGTSMSCPHAAGIAALIKGVHPTWSPAAIRSAMMTTSDVLDNTQGPITDIFGPTDPLSMGAGLLN